MMISYSLSEALQELIRILWTRFATLILRLGHGLDHGALLHALTTRRGYGGAEYGYMVALGQTWNGQASCYR